MRKRFLRSGVVAIASSLVLFATNWILGSLTGNIIGITMYGGEWVGSIGFGVMQETIYRLVAEDDPASTMIRLTVEPISLLLTAVAVFVVTFVISTILAKKRTKRGIA